MCESGCDGFVGRPEACAGAGSPGEWRCPPSLPPAPCLSLGGVPSIDSLFSGLSPAPPSLYLSHSLGSDLYLNHQALASNHKKKTTCLLN